MVEVLYEAARCTCLACHGNSVHKKAGTLHRLESRPGWVESAIRADHWNEPRLVEVRFKVRDSVVALPCVWQRIIPKTELNAQPWIHVPVILRELDRKSVV